MQLIFRYDDYSAAEQFAYEVDEAVFNLFLALRVPLLVAVTPRMTAAMRDPFNQKFFAIEEDDPRIELLSRGLQQGWQLALHGYTHQSTPALSGNEFKGEPKAVQEEKIIAGLRLLQQCFPSAPIEVFVPPWNSYDEVTTTCLIEQGFTVLCAGDAEMPRRVGLLTFVPSLMSPCDLADYLDFYSLEDLIQEVGRGRLVITLHEYEFRVSGRNDYVGIEKLAEMMQRLLASGAEIVTLDTAAPVSDYLLKGHRRFRAKIYLLQLIRHGRVLWLLRLTERLIHVLGTQRATAVRSVVAQVYWAFEQSHLRLRTWLRPIKTWMRAQRQQTDRKRRSDTWSL